MLNKKIVKTAGIVIVVLGMLMLTSCLGIEMKTVFNADGSGRMTMKLRVSQSILEMGGEEAGIDMPLSKDDFSREYEGVEGVTVVDVTQEDTEEDRIITAVIDFKDFNALSADENLPGMGSSLELKDGKHVLKVPVGENAGDENQSSDGTETAESAEMDESMIAMMQSFLGGYNLEYKIVAPSKILSHTAGEVEKDGRPLVFSMPMGDYIMIKEPFFLEVVW